MSTTDDDADDDAARRIAALPRRADEVWQAAVLRMPMWVMEPGKPPLRPSAAVTPAVVLRVLAELGAEVRLGDPVAELAGRPLAATWAYAPGWKRRDRRLDVVALHPWPWLRRPGSGSLRSYSAWAR